MDFEALSTMIALILAISLAAERLVAMLKNMLPWLRSSENNTLISNQLGGGMSEAGMKGKMGIVDFGYMRSQMVMALAFCASWFTAAFFAEGDSLITLNKFFGSVPLQSGDKPLEIPVILLALLASGGSEFWKNLLGYTKAMRDIKIGERSQPVIHPLESK